jgi:aryl-alcohol dehydrogenase-like predicted oxidoreductase
MAQRPFIVPIPGTTKLHHVKEDIGAINVKFTQEELEEFRNEFSKIELIGVRPTESALTDS